VKPEIEISLLIDDYLNNRLDISNTLAFEERLANDKELNEKIEEQIMINEAIHFAGLAQLRESIGNDLNKIPYNKTNLKPWIYTSIGILAIAGFTYFFINENHKDRSKDIKTEIKTTFKKDTSSTPKNINTPVIEIVPTTKSSEIIVKEKLVVNNKKSNIVKDIPIPEKLTTNNTTFKDVIKPVNEKTITPILSESPITPKEIVCNNTLNNTSTASCKQEATGSIKLNLTNKASATFEIKELRKSNKNGIFTNIEAGIYTIFVKDEFNCEYTKKISISEKWCSINKNFSFAPFYGEKWNIVYDKEDFGKYSIFDQMNKLVKNGEFGTDNIEWDGKSNNYEALPTGLYRAIIDYSDGKKEIVEITIIN
jgi:hypothetical protein